MAFRDGPFENIKVPLVWTAAVVAVVAIVAAVVLLLSDRPTAEGGSSMGVARGGFETAAAPVGGVLAAPVRWAGGVRDYIGGYFFAIGENRRLRAENAELREWRDQAIALKNVNSRYEAMLGLRVEPAVAMATGRVISDARGPFNRAKLLDVGSAQGVRIGNPVVSEHGLVGRITGVTSRVSRMVLLTDVASRTPVMIERTDARAMLTGDGGDSPRLEFIRGTGAVQAGDRILSSGDGGGLPRGLPIGVAAKGVDGAWRVKLFSDHGAVDYVRVLLFQSFGQLVSPDALNAPALAGLTTAPEPSAAELGAIHDAAARRQAAQQAQAQQQAERVRAAAAAAATAATAPPPAAATPRPAPTAARPAARATPTPPPTPGPSQTAPSQPPPAPAPDGAL